MSAIRRGKIYARKRVNLGEVVPLPVPFSVQIDVCSACNLKCKFCVHSDREAVKKAEVNWGIMPLTLFTRIIDDMKVKWGGVKIKKLRLFQIGEPLLNPHICEMIKYAKDADVAECIEITTNGTLLNPEMNIKLIEAGLDILNISVNGISQEQYKQVCEVDLDLDEFRKNIEHFYLNRGDCQIFIKYGDIGYSEEEKNDFYQLFDKICDEIFVETISATLWQDTNISDNVVNAHIGTYGQELVHKEVCPFLFTNLVITDSGIAHLCCVDWKIQHVLGDLKKDSIADIWNGEVLRKYQLLHLNKQKNCIDICKECESLSANTTDNVDDYSEEIIRRMQKQ